MREKETIRRVKIGLSIVTLITMGLYTWNKWDLNNKFDTSYPTIHFEEEFLETSVKVTEEELLKGVTAKDGKDGDVTDSIIIESMSNMLDNNQRIVTYVAFDSDNHVGKAERRIQYTDYTPIRFSLSDAINTASGTSAEDVRNALKAIDCIDGDISGQIIPSDITYMGEKDKYVLYEYTFKVTNSSGEVAEITLPVKLNYKDTSLQSGSIRLKTGLVYLKVGQEIDLQSYISEVTLGIKEHQAEDVVITTDLDTTKTGTYVVTYSISVDGKGATSDMIIVVEE